MKSLALFDKCHKLPFGTYIFSRLICFKAPYFKTISPHVVALRPNFAEVKMRKKRKVQNHIKSVHAIAMCNMAELAGGLMTDASLPKGRQWIPKGMDVKYLKIATTDLVAVAKGDEVDWDKKGGVIVPVVIKNTQNKVVFKADITMYLR